MTYSIPDLPSESENLLPASEMASETAPVSVARRRRQRRTLLPRDPEGRATVLVNLARRSYPSIEFFIFAAISGLVLGAGYLLDSPTVLVLGALLAPLMTPWVGMTLAAVTGSARFFLQTLAAILVAALLAFAGATLAGVLARAFMPLTLNLGYYHSRLWPVDLAVLALGAILLTISFLRSEEKPYLPSAMMAYQVFLPLTAAGFGLGAGLDGFWPEGLLVFITHLALATFFGGLTLAILRFWPRTLIATGVSLAIFLSLLVALVSLTGLGGQLLDSLTMKKSRPSSVTTAEPMPVTNPDLSFTEEPLGLLAGTSTPPPTLPFRVTILPSPTFDPSILPTLPPSQTPTATIPPEPTPVYALINARGYGGAFLRKEPGGSVLLTLDNGDVVRVLSEEHEFEGKIFVHVVATRGETNYDGWILQSVLVTATPVPGW